MIITLATSRAVTQVDRCKSTSSISPPAKVGQFLYTPRDAIHTCMRVQRMEYKTLSYRARSAVFGIALYNQEPAMLMTQHGFLRSILFELTSASRDFGKCGWVLCLWRTTLRTGHQSVGNRLLIIYLDKNKDKYKHILIWIKYIRCIRV